MKPLFIDVIGSDNKKYRVNANLIMYFSATERKGSMLTEIVFSNKEYIESEETPSDIEGKINRLQDERVLSN